MSDRPRFHAERITNSLWVGLLTYRRSRLCGLKPSAFPGSPEWLMEGQFSCLQWRDRAGLAPASLLCPRGHPKCLNSTIAQTDRRNANSRLRTGSGSGQSRPFPVRRRVFSWRQRSPRAARATSILDSALQPEIGERPWRDSRTRRDREWQLESIHHGLYGSPQDESWQSCAPHQAVSPARLPSGFGGAVGGIGIAVVCHLLPDFNGVPPESPADARVAVPGRCRSIADAAWEHPWGFLRMASRVKF